MSQNVGRPIITLRVMVEVVMDEKAVDAFYHLEGSRSPTQIKQYFTEEIQGLVADMVEVYEDGLKDNGVWEDDTMDDDEEETEERWNE